MAADVDKGTDNGAHHVAQEAVGCDLEVPAVGAFAMPCGGAEIADVGLDVGVQLGE